MIKKKFPNKKKFFTLIELVIVMAMLVVVMAVVAQIYNSSYKATASTSKHTMIFDNAKIALDLMTRELQSIYYDNGKTPFWHWKPVDPKSPPATWGDYRNELLAFVSVTNFPQNDSSTSKIAEIKYQKYYATSHGDPNDGWLRRSVTMNKLSDSSDNAKWNYYNNIKVGYTTTLVTDTPVAAFTVNSVSSTDYEKVIPYVTDLTFICLDKEGNEIIPDQTTSIGADLGTTTGLPFSIEITLKLMDKASWQKWIDIGGNINPLNDTTSVKTFRKKHERTFKKTILIGNRGQYN